MEKKKKKLELNESQRETKMTENNVVSSEKMTLFGRNSYVVRSGCGSDFVA